MVAHIGDKDKQLADFWDIESLLPAKKPTSIRPPSMSTETVEIEFDAPVKSLSSGESVEEAQKLPQFIAPHTVSTKKAEVVVPVLTYQPKHPLIGTVRIYPWRSNFNFYERFCHMAEALFERSGEACPPVPFFSYMPQYDQMNRSQLDWYLYWRDCVRKGEYLDTDYSYIFLYLFEIINLSNRILPEQGQKMMCDIWRQYRKAYPLLNRYLADWICDYSLIHQLPPPARYLSDLVPLMAENSSFKEFYACTASSEAVQEAAIYLTFCTNYHYQKSKLYLSGNEQATAMDTHVAGALTAVIRKLESQNSAFSHSNMQKATLCRDSFIGALCSGHMKRRIEVEYCSFTRSHELRFLITDIVKYTENRLRSVFGMKSRLSIYGLPEQVKEALDEYLNAALPAKRRLLPAERPAYEALYDVACTGVSPRRAQEIERTSWDITRQLVDAFQEEACDTPVEEISIPKPVVGAEADNELAQALSAYAPMLRAIDREDADEQRSICLSMGKMMDAVIEEINVISSDTIGDILIEDGDNGYLLIEDYRSYVALLL